jgi:hypothetical protein
MTIVVNPGYYFDQAAEEYSLKSGTIYDLVLTQPLPLDECEVHGNNHPRCISSKCTCSDPPTSRASVHRAGLKQARRTIRRSPEIQRLRRSPEIQRLLKTVPSLSMQHLMPK